MNTKITKIEERPDNHGLDQYVDGQDKSIHKKSTQSNVPPTMHKNRYTSQVYAVDSIVRRVRKGARVKFLVC